jgi:formate dehydrogenase maturation protein FdhE
VSADIHMSAETLAVLAALSTEQLAAANQGALCPKCGELHLISSLAGNENPNGSGKPRYDCRVCFAWWERT